jgi:hypothetical protein
MAATPLWPAVALFAVVPAIMDDASGRLFSFEELQATKKLIEIK